MFGYALTTLDDRQRRVPILDHIAARGDGELTEMSVRFAESSSMAQPGLRWTHVLWVIAFILTVAGMIALGRVFPTLPSWLWGAVWPAIFITVSLIATSRRRRRHAYRLVEGLLHIGRCASCGYRLANLPSESDGAIVCPECGAAWNSERVGTVTLTQFQPPGNRPGDTPPGNRRWIAWITMTPTVLDARERPLPVADLWTRGARSPFDPVLRATLWSEFAEATRWTRLAMTGATLLLMLFFAAVVVLNLIKGALTPVSLFSALVIFWLSVIYGIIAWRSWNGRGRGAARSARDILVRHHLCASCATPLSSENSDADLLTCPKCHAEWRVPPAR